MLTPVMRSKIDVLWDRFWSGGITNPLTVMEQISYLLFMRRLDALDQKRKEDAEWAGSSYKSLFGKKYADCRWSKFKHSPDADELLVHVRDTVFPFIKTLRAEDEPFAKSMKDAVFMIPKASLLVEAIGIIDELYAEIERERQEGGQTFHDTQGDLYEHLLSEISTAGKNGQFRTPRHIIQMIVAMVDPKLGEQVCDPACGTGGFLLGAYQHILTAHTSKKLRWKDEASGLERGLVGDKLTKEKQWKVLKEQSLYGFDFDTTMVRIGLMNLLLHGLDHPNLGYMDTLSKRFEEAGRYQVVLANPPFKGNIDKSDINEDLSLSTTKTELLFVNRILNLLQLGGRAGVVVPEGVLFGRSRAHKDLRKMLLDDCELQAVISMPSGVFKPYASVSSAVLVFVKGGKTETVWFYDLQADGRSLDDRRVPIDENDIPHLIARWQSRTECGDERVGRCFTVPAEIIRKKNYSLSFKLYREINFDEEKLASPSSLLKRIKAEEKQITRLVAELEEMVG